MTEISEKLKTKIAVKRAEIRLGERIAELQDKINEQRFEALQSRKELDAARGVIQQAKNIARKAVNTAYAKQAQLEESRRTIEHLLDSQVPNSIAPIEQVELGAPLSEMIESFYKECKDVKLKADKTLIQAKSNLARFMDILGPLHIGEITAEQVRYYRDVIRSIPKNLTKKAIWKERPEDWHARKIWYMELGSRGLPKLAEGGQDTHFSDVRAFLSWLSTERYLKEDFSSMLTPVKNSNDTESGGIPFSSEDIKILVDKHWCTDGKSVRNEQPKDWHFWAPLIALTMGLRGDEIGRLAVSDIMQVDDITMMRVPGTKTTNALRHVPVPDVVISAGFPLLVEHRRTKDGIEGRLFPDWGLGGGKTTKNYATTLSKWFNKQQRSLNGTEPQQILSGLVVQLGIWQPDHQVSVHSLRHSFVTCSWHSGVGQELIQMIVGHGTDLSKTYGLPVLKRLGATADYLKLDVLNSPRLKEACVELKAAINSVDFGCDLSGLDWMRWRTAKKMKALI